MPASRGMVCVSISIDGVSASAEPTGALRDALVGPHEDDPRWSWLGSAIDCLRKYAAADEDPQAVYECASVLDEMHAEIRAALAESPVAAEREADS